MCVVAAVIFIIFSAAGLTAKSNYHPYCTTLIDCADEYGGVDRNLAVENKLKGLFPRVERTVIVSYKDRDLYSAPSQSGQTSSYQSESRFPIFGLNQNFNSTERRATRNSVLRRIEEILNSVVSSVNSPVKLGRELFVDGVRKGFRSNGFDERNFDSENNESDPLVTTYLSHLHMEVLSVPRFIDARKFLNIIKSNEGVQNGWIDDIVVAPETLKGPLFEGRLRESWVTNGTRFIPNDAELRRQWHHLDRTFGIGTPEAWAVWRGGDPKKPVVIAVMDSGTDTSHPDLVNRIWRNPHETCDNGVDDDRNGLVDDCDGWNFTEDNSNVTDVLQHGTHVAGVIAAEANNAIGVAGICSNCVIMTLKCLFDDNSGRVSFFIRALDYALSKGVRISNHSWAVRRTTAEYPSLDAAIRQAHKVGHIFVAAAGNYGLSNDAEDYNPPPWDRGEALITIPGAFRHSNVISVASITSEGRKASFSNWGQKSVQLAAPGQQIYTTSTGAKYKYVLGTSFSAPMVSGALGMLLDREPDLSIRELKRRIVDNVMPVEAMAGFVTSGGILRVDRAMLDPGLGDQSNATRITYPHLCPDGYQRRMNKCVDVNECERERNCPIDSKCVNTEGSFRCECNFGYHWKGLKCEDIDECLISESGGKRVSSFICPLGATCVNLPGTFDCRCPIGSVWGGPDSQDNMVAHEIQILSKDNAPKSNCTLIGIPTSVFCENNGPCGPNAKCRIDYYGNDIAAPACDCYPGYVKINSKECVRPGTRNVAHYYKQIGYDKYGAT